MNYLLKSREKKDSVRKSISVAVIITVILILFSLIFRNITSRILFAIGDPLWNGNNFISKLIRSSFEGFFNSVELSNRIMTYEVKEAEWNVKDQEISVLQNRISEMENIMNRASTSKVVIAGVLKIPPAIPFDTLLIDAGSKNGIAFGQKVYASQAFLMGEISETFPDTAKVKLYSTSGEKFQVRLGASSTTYEAVGRGGGEFSVSAPRDAKIKVGDLALFPGLGGDTAGVVAYVEEDPAKIFEEVYVRFPIPFSLLDTVFIKIGY